ncbi:unnamed protein product [Danaus chrysippus]|uniref:(African queen) hypothetical protein n=1 Tax=Danaus chrysippus TaxID=151541 RepID=A0A8J2VT39_9NEOP|nr:unnamed protein product [Danaus chrysippus]
MNKTRQNAQKMLFNHETTYRTDYYKYDIKEYPKTQYREKQSHHERGLPTYKNCHTLMEWKDQRPPFSCYHVAKDVLRTNPNNVQRPCAKPVDHDREDAQKTRPRLVMTPAVSLDDIEDSSARDIIISDMYMTDNMKNMKIAVITAPREGAKAPLTGRPAPANPVFLPKYQPPYVSPEWRMESVSWDQKQLRSHCDPTQRFWLLHELPKCKACEETAVVVAHRKMLRNLKHNNV